MWNIAFACLIFVLALCFQLTDRTSLQSLSREHLKNGPRTPFLDKIMKFFSDIGQEKGVALNILLAIGFLRPGDAWCMVVFYNFMVLVWTTHKWYTQEPRP
jgi:hypothetical protein